MFPAVAPLLARLAIFFVAGLAAGISNGIAGGGTFITFPTMMAMGIPALTSNVSGSVGIVTSTVGGLRSFRWDLSSQKAVVLSLLPSCILGTATGCTLLLVGSPNTFRSVIPWLIGAGTVLFACSPLITKRLAHLDQDHTSRKVILYGGIFFVSVYGGYFGAGMGVLLLAVMAISLPYDIKELQGIRYLIALVINISAALIFVIRGHLNNDAVVMILFGALIGGYLGARLIKRLSPTMVRVLVVLVGLITTVHLFLTA